MHSANLGRKRWSISGELEMGLTPLPDFCRIVAFWDVSLCELGEEALVYFGETGYPLDSPTRFLPNCCLLGCVTRRRQRARDGPWRSRWREPWLPPAQRGGRTASLGFSIAAD